MSSNENDYSWVTQEMFDEKLEKILDDQTGGSLLIIPGVYEIVREYFNNDVLEALEEEREEDDEDDDEDDEDEWEDPEEL